MERIKGGATIWARQTIDSDIFFYKPAEWFKIWFYIVNQVNHADTRLFKRGDNLFTYQDISTSTMSTQAQVKHCLEYLRKANMIATHRTTRGLVITVTKYGFFQKLDNYSYTESQSESPTKSQSLANRKPIASPTINKNDKNDKNEKNEKNEKNIELFESFWVAYPRKTAKAVAQKSFSKIDNDLFPTLMTALEVQKLTWNDPKYIPHASTWLNGKRWNDEIIVSGNPMDDYARGCLKKWAGDHDQAGFEFTKKYDPTDLLKVKHIIHL